MSDSNNQDSEFLIIKFIQSGEIKSIPLTEANRNKKFKDIYFPLLKESKLSKKDVFLSNNSGKALANFHLNLTIEEIIAKFGNTINLYYEKII